MGSIVEDIRMEHESPTAPALQMTRPRPRESLRVWEERGKGHECLLMLCGVRFRPDDVLLSPSAKGKLIGKAGRTPRTMYEGTIGWENARLS